MSKFLISCGGTGGHLSPGISLAEGLAAHGHESVLLVSQKKVDARLLEKYPLLRFKRMPGTGFAWHPVKLVRCLFTQTRAFFFCLRLIHESRVDAIVGFGGFTSAPLMVAGWLLGVPAVLHEANRVPGLAIRLLGRFSRRVYLPPGVRLGSVRAGATFHVGLPVRREIVRLPQEAARAALGLDANQRLLVVLGGSQGSSALNDWARQRMQSLAAEGIQLFCVTGLGKGNDEVVEMKTKAGAPIRAVFAAFSDRMAELMSAADLVVSRAGAGTLAELIRCETPAILVPYPQAADDHQRANAAYFEQQGGGIVVAQTRLGDLHAEVLDAIFNDWLLRKFRGNLRRMDHVNALELMLRDLEEIVPTPGGRAPAPSRRPPKISNESRSGGRTMRLQAPPRLFGREVRGIHAVGVGGMGVGPLAIYLAQLGFSVSGEDDALTGEMRAILEREGVKIGGIPPEVDLVMYSSAIAKTHPAYLAATRRALPLVRRGELLAEATRGKKLVAVCGSHGKTTTTAMLATILRRANFPAGYILGGLFADDTPPARAGSNDWVVAEVDESDGTIEHFSPEIAVTVNLDWDHPDFYRQLADLEAMFAGLFQRTRGTVLVSDACAMSGRILGRAAAVDGDLRAPSSGDEPNGARRSPSTFTFGRSGDFRGEVVSESGERMTLRLGGKFALREATVRARGEFNAANAAAALAAAQLMGAEISARGLADYPAVRRRQAVLHEADGLTVIEDYAHHPAEIRALLASLRRRVATSAAAQGRLVVVFQPHRFSRTAQFKGEFAAALAAADSVHLLDVYAAGEAPIAGGTTADIYAELKKNAAALPVSYLPGDDAEFFHALSREVRRGDLVAFVGAGDIDRKAREWLATVRAAAIEIRRWDELAEALRAGVSVETKVKREESLAAKTTMRVGGAARVYAEPAAREDLQALLRTAHAREVEVFILGRGSNLIVPDEGVDGLVLALAHESWAGFELDGEGRVWAGAGLRLKNLCGLAAKAGLVGFEFLEGIPGSVGGALRMNAGAMGGWMFDVVEAVETISRTGELKTFERAAMHVEYRHCAELHDAIALRALLRPASQSDADAIKRQMDAYARKRHESQPREPSAGCIFKNPPGNSAGRLIDECGLKGERVGDAEVSVVHANFIVNRGRATGADVLELVRRVRARVLQAKGVDLEPEVLLYGKKWEDVL